MKLTATVFLLGVLALAGIPPLAGFFSKDLILETTAKAPLAMALCMSTALITPYYMGRAFFLAFTGEARSDSARHAHESGWLMTGPMMLLAALTLGAGFLAAPFAQRIGLPYEFHLGPIGVAALVLSVAGLSLAYLLHGRKEPVRVPDLRPLVALLRGGYVDRAYEVAYRRGLLSVSRAIGWIDRYVVDGLVNVAGLAALSTGSRLRAMQTGQAQDYVFALILAFVLLSAFGLFGG